MHPWKIFKRNIFKKSLEVFIIEKVKKLLEKSVKDRPEITLGGISVETSGEFSGRIHE